MRYTTVAITAARTKERLQLDQVGVNQPGGGPLAPGSRPITERSGWALQGGGAHGAFTWGVLDALLEDGRLAVEAITGASAGAMNAVVMVEGWLDGGIDGARSGRQITRRENRIVRQHQETALGLDEPLPKTPRLRAARAPRAAG